MKKQVSKKAMAMTSKNGGALDSHSSSSSSSSGGASTNVSGVIIGGVKGQDFPKKLNRSHKNSIHGKQNYKQHLYKNVQKSSAPSLNRNVEYVFIDNDEELADEFEGLRITKKTNLSHLLNFRYSDSTALERNYDNRQNRSSHYTGLYTRKHHYQKVYDKYQFIQANCKFVVDVSFDDVLSPDQFIEWDKIVQVQLLAPNIPYCPICLENSPTAPRITKCGHVYCFPCVLQLISLSDHKWAKCPICYDAVSEVDLRDVKCLNKKLYKIGDTITFNLMARNRNSLKVERVIKRTPDDDESVDGLSESVAILEMDLEKITKYDCEQQILLVHQPALQSLELRKQEFNEEEENKFICLALEKVETAIKVLKDASCEKHEEVEVDVDSCSTQDLFKKDLFRDGDGNCRGNTGISASDKYHFYQSSDGQLIFPNSFNIRCLLKEYGNLERGLETLSGQVVDLCETRVDEYFRSKYRFLGHLPLTTVVTFAEIDLRPPTLSKQTLKYFADEIRRRKEEKDRKRKEERKRDNRINREMQKKMGGYLGHSNSTFYCEDEQDEEGAMFERMGLAEENFPSFSSSKCPSEDTKEPLRKDRERHDSSVCAAETNEDSSDRGVDDLGWGSRPGMQFTSFANVLMTTCGSPTNKNFSSAWGSIPGGCKRQEDSVPSSSSAWSKSSDLTIPKSLSYAQRLNLVEKNDEELRSVAIFAESEDVDIDLPAPTFNESFSVAFEKALFKQGGQKSKKKKKNGTKLSLEDFNSPE